MEWLPKLLDSMDSCVFAARTVACGGRARALLAIFLLVTALIAVAAAGLSWLVAVPGTALGAALWGRSGLCLRATAMRRRG